MNAATATATRRGHLRKGGPSGQRKINGELLGVREAAEFLGFSEGAVRIRTKRGLLPHRRDGRRIVYLRRELATWVARRPVVVSVAAALENAQLQEAGT